MSVNTETKILNLQPSWLETARMLLLLLEAGDGEGKTFAQKEVLRMGVLLDELIKEREKS